jgi:hypothetical protein
VNKVARCLLALVVVLVTVSGCGDLYCGRPRRMSAHGSGAAGLCPLRPTMAVTANYAYGENHERRPGSWH